MKRPAPRSRWEKSRAKRSGFLQGELSETDHQALGGARRAERIPGLEWWFEPIDRFHPNHVESDDAFQKIGAILRWVQDRFDATGPTSSPTNCPVNVSVIEGTLLAWGNR